MSFHIEFLIDISLSMKDNVSDLVYSFNNFIEDQKIINQNNNNLTISLNVFNDKYNTIYNNININLIKPLSSYDLNCCSTTSLYDSIAFTIQKIKDNINIDINNDKIIFVIMTDGYDNSSIKYINTDIMNMIINKENNNWKFIYLGANQNAIGVARELGIDENSALSYNQNSHGIYNVLKSTSNSIIKLRNGEENKINFNELDRFASLSI